MTRHSSIASVGFWECRKKMIKISKVDFRYIVLVCMLTKVRYKYPKRVLSRRVHHQNISRLETCATSSEKQLNSTSELTMLLQLSTPRTDPRRTHRRRTEPAPRQWRGTLMEPCCNPDSPSNCCPGLKSRTFKVDSFPSAPFRHSLTARADRDAPNKERPVRTSARSRSLWRLQ